VASHRRDGFAVVCERMDEPSRVEEKRGEAKNEAHIDETANELAAQAGGLIGANSAPNGRSRLERPKPELARDPGAFCTDGFCAMAGNQFQAKT
jgi:hypothetical protein